MDSLLAQTFQDFEVIVVDDCSTDNSVAIVGGYAPKFGGRLQLAKTKKNSGGGGYVPRNIGLSLAQGEYIYFIDADDFILLSALETLYTTAKDNNTDVVYNGACYVMRQPNDIYLWRDRLSDRLIEEGIEDIPTLILDDQDKLLNQLIIVGLHHMPYTKFIRRDFLLENKIDFPTIFSGGDFIWTIQVFGFSKRCLRIPNSLYFYRSNPDSITLGHKSPEEQISTCLKAFALGAEALLELSNKVVLLKREPRYFYYVLRSFWNSFLRRTFVERGKISSSDVYEILYREFGNKRDVFGLIMSFFVGVFDEFKKLDREHLQLVEQLNKRIDQMKDALVSSPAVNMKFLVPKNDSGVPAISVIIPLYNAEKYVADCLDSLLAQTFQDFEIIVVDDCSTDNSVTLVEGYMPKFNDRLKLHLLKENSGSGGVPRNKGIILSQGEYIKFLDADDMLTNTALAELYSLAKEYDADVVHCPRNYAIDNDGSNLRIAPKTSIEKPTLETRNFKELMVKITKKGYGATYCQFVRRSLMIENEIFFPQIFPSEDLVWSYNLIFYAEKFLSAPNAVYIIRSSENSMMRKKRTSQDIVKFRLNAALFGITPLDESLSRHKFLVNNPSYRYYLLERFLIHEIDQSVGHTQNIADDEIYSIIKDAFGNRLGDWSVLVSALCTALYKSKRNENEQSELINKIKLFINARIDITFNFSKEYFQILNISDDKTTVSYWIQKEKVDCKISSITGILKFIVKVAVTGKVSLLLRGRDIRDKKDKSKCIPYWIDYTKLIIKGKTILDKLTPAWYNKPYIHDMTVNAGEEIAIQVEWLPHRSDNIETQSVVPLSSKIEIPVLNEFKTNLVARIDVNFLSKVAGGDFQILSVSDEKAEILKPTWLQNNGISYMIQSCSGKLEFLSKVTANGKIAFKLRGKEVRTPEDWKNRINRRIPYWIDYTALTVNEKIILDTLTPTWFDKPYNYTMEVKAGEEIKVKVEWLIHRSDT